MTSATDNFAACGRKKGTKGGVLNTKKQHLAELTSLEQ